MTENKRNRPLRWVGVGLLSAVLLVAGCSKTESDKNPEASAVKPEALVEQVLKLQLNAPDKEMLDLMWDEKNQEVVDGVLMNPKFDMYITQQYGEYFTAEALDTFMRTFGTTYHNLADTEGYEMDLGNLAIEKSEQADNRYNFVATVNLEKEDGSELMKEIEGIATISTDFGKIGKFEYVSDDGLTFP